MRLDTVNLRWLQPRVIQRLLDHSRLSRSIWDRNSTTGPILIHSTSSNYAEDLITIFDRLRQPF